MPRTATPKPKTTPNPQFLTFYEDHGAVSRHLTTVMDKATAFVRHFDSQTNILIGLSSAIFVFSLSQMTNHTGFAASFALLAVFSGLSSILSLFAIHPPRFMRKQRQAESMMYNRKVTSFKTYKAYAAALTELMQDKEQVIDDYAREIYNLYRYYYRPKRDFFNWARSTLLLGIILAVGVFIMTL